VFARGVMDERQGALDSIAGTGVSGADDFHASIVACRAP
jgi:hypothetical protein